MHIIHLYSFFFNCQTAILNPLRVPDKWTTLQMDQNYLYYVNNGPQVNWTIRHLDQHHIGPDAINRAYWTFRWTSWVTALKIGIRILETLIYAPNSWNYTKYTICPSRVLKTRFMQYFEKIGVYQNLRKSGVLWTLKKEIVTLVYFFLGWEGAPESENSMFKVSEL